MKRIAARLRADSHTWAIASAVAVAAAVTAVCTAPLRLLNPDTFGASRWGMPWDAVAAAPGAPAAATMSGLDQTLFWLGALAVSICFLSLLLHAVGGILSAWNALAIRAALGAHTLHLWWLVCRRFLRGGVAGMALGVAAGTVLTTWLGGARPDLVSGPEQSWWGVAVAAGVGAGFLLVLLLLALPPAVLLTSRAALTPALQGDHTTSGRPALTVQGLLPVLQFAGLLVVTFASYVLWRELPAGDAATFDGAVATVTTASIATDTSIAERAMAWRDLLHAVQLGGDTATVTSHNAWLGLGPIVPVMGFCDSCFRGQFFTPVTSERVRLIALSPESLSVMAGEVVRGREFSDGDGPDAPPVVLLNDAAALRLFPGADSLDRPLRIGGANGVEHTVAGVVRLPRPFGPGNTAPVVPAVFVSIFQHPPFVIDVASAGDVRAAEAVAALASVPPIVIEEPRTITTELRAFGAPLRFASMLFTGVGAAATAIATFGLIAVMFQLVETRRREMAIRLALGARKRHILAWVGRRALRLTLIGVVLGMSGARWLWDVVLVNRSADGVFGPVALMAIAFGAIALLASVLPGLRASILHPAVLARAIPSTTRDR